MILTRQGHCKYPRALGGPFALVGDLNARYEPPETTLAVTFGDAEATTVPVRQTLDLDLPPDAPVRSPDVG